MRRNTFKFALVSLVIALGLGAAVYAATSAVITMLDASQQPLYGVTVTDPVDDVGCDVVTMVMSDATGGIVDIDNFCADLVTGVGSDYTDWGSYVSGYVPTTGPITYSLYDTSGSDACSVDENSAECAALTDGLACIGETTYQPGTLPAGTPYSRCNFAAASTGCALGIPSGSVVGEAPAGAQAYYAPGQATNFSINPGTYIVVGQDESETYYKIVLACRFLWVRKDTMQPSFQAPQNGAPLPTRIVS